MISQIDRKYYFVGKRWRRQSQPFSGMALTFSTIQNKQKFKLRAGYVLTVSLSNGDWDRFICES